VLLSDEQLRRYDEDGVLAIDRMIDDDTVAELRMAYGEILSRLADAPADHMLGGRIRVVTWPSTAPARLYRQLRQPEQGPASGRGGLTGWQKKTW
jgi:hypothetical protein